MSNLTIGMEDESSENVDIPVTRVEFCILVVVLSLLCVFGTTGNALILFVFSRKKGELVSTLFIICLAFVDFVTCLVVIPLTLYMEFVEFRISVDLLCKLYQFLITSNIPFSAFVMVAIAVDRYLCICHPFVRCFSIPRAMLTVTLLGVMATCIGVCVALMYGVLPVSPTMYSTVFEDILQHSNITEAIRVDDGAFNITPRPIAVAIIAEQRQTESVFHVFAASMRGHNISDVLVGNWMEVAEPVGTRCMPTNATVSHEFVQLYQKCYTAMFLMCFLAVVLLYILIYRSVLQRRSKRRRQKSIVSLRVMSDATQYDVKKASTSKNPPRNDPTGSRGRETPKARDKAYSVDMDGASDNFSVAEASNGDGLSERPTRSAVSLARRDQIANLKTAAMLFVVTLVFIVTFLPAFLMALQLIPYNIVIFYAYFANNVANPVIYSFMNRNFRQNVSRMFLRPSSRTAGSRTGRTASR